MPDAVAERAIGAALRQMRMASRVNIVASGDRVVRPVASVGGRGLAAAPAGMKLIRSFEEQVRNLAAGGVVPGLVHLCAGQEAVAVGVCSVLRRRRRDRQQSPWSRPLPRQGRRSDLLMAEILGRRSGYGLGRSGSLHIFDVANGNLGTNGIVGGGIPLAAGAALSAKRRGRGERGGMLFRRRRAQSGLDVRSHEHGCDLAVAGAVRLREQRLRRIHRHRGRHRRTRPDRARRRFRHSLRSRGRNGRAGGAGGRAARAVARARAGGGPSFLVCTTYRYSGHHVGDKQDYKAEDEAEAGDARIRSCASRRCCRMKAMATSSGDRGD